MNNLERLAVRFLLNTLEIEHADAMLKSGTTDLDLIRIAAERKTDAHHVTKQLRDAVQIELAKPVDY